MAGDGFESRGAVRSAIISSMLGGEREIGIVSPHFYIRGHYTYLPRGCGRATLGSWPASPAL